jgi:hypothetical protein
VARMLGGRNRLWDPSGTQNPASGTQNPEVNGGYTGEWYVDMFYFENQGALKVKATRFGRQ